MTIKAVCSTETMLKTIEEQAKVIEILSGLLLELAMAIQMLQEE